MIKINEKAPGFTLPDQNGNLHSLENYLGKWVLLYFYPKDDTPGCTKEACKIRDDFFKFDKIKAKVLGISTDSVASHKKFSEKYKLPFTILSDEDKSVVNLYGVWGEKKFLGRSYMGTKRESFLIDPEGAVKKIYEKVNPITHAGEVLNDLEAFSIS